MTEPMRWRMFGYMAALFVAGAICGAAVVYHLNTTSQSLKIGRTEEITRLVLQKLAINLDLTPEQREKIRPLVRKTAEEMEASHLDCLNRISQAVDKLHAQIAMDLTPEQREKLKQVEADRHVLMRKKYNYPPDAANMGVP